MPRHDTNLYSRREPENWRSLQFVDASLKGLGLSEVEGASRRIGVQSYSFRTMPLDDAIKAMTDIGIGECELFSGHVEPRPPPAPSAARSAAGRSCRARRVAWKTPRLAADDAARPFRCGSQEVRRRWDQAAPTTSASTTASPTPEIDRGFGRWPNARRWVYHGVVDVDGGEARRTVRGKTPDDGRDARARELRRSERVREAESFEKAMAMSKRFAVNLDIGHFFAAGPDPLPTSSSTTIGSRTFI